MYTFHGLHSELQLLSISQNQTQIVVFHLKLWKVYVCNAWSTITHIYRAWNSYFRNEKWMNLWMNGCSFPKRPLGQKNVRWGFLFLTLRQSDLLWGLTPWGRLKHKAVLGYLHFGLHQRPSPLPAPQPHTSRLFKNAAGQVKRMPFLSSLLHQRGCEGHICAAP